MDHFSNGRPVIVDDDIAIPNSPNPRGVAGTLFVHKICGHMSEQGCSLEDILSTANSVASDTVTIGVARDSCNIPGGEKEERIDDGYVEVGLGIHGEPGVELRKFQSAKELAGDLMLRVKSMLPADPGAENRYALLINNLGGLSSIEMSVMTASLLNHPLAQKIDLVIGPAPLMTALDMPGLSVSLLKLQEHFVEALNAPVGPSAWPPAMEMTEVSDFTAPILHDGDDAPASDDALVRRVIEHIAITCIEMEGDINNLDAKVGDGDTGSTFATAGRAVLDQLPTYPLADGASLLSVLSRMTSQSIGGSSGVLFGIFFSGAAERYRLTGEWPQSFANGLSLMKKYGGADIGDRTLIDALQPAVDGLNAGLSMARIAELAQGGAKTTARMSKANAGRSAYLDARSLQGVMDPGAAAIARIFAALASSAFEASGERASAKDYFKESLR